MRRNAELAETVAWPTITHDLSGRSLDAQAQWTLAATLLAMSNAALKGLTLRHTQAVVDHLRIAARSSSVPEELRHACDRLSDLWRTIDLQ